MNLMHRKSGSQFSIEGLRTKRKSNEPMQVNSTVEEEVIESPKSRRKRIKESDTVENDRHKDDAFNESKKKMVVRRRG